LEKVDAGYYPRELGNDAPLTRRDRKMRRDRQAVRTRHEREESEKTVPDPEALERQILQLREQLDHAIRTVVKRDDVITALEKGNDDLRRSLHKLKTRMRQVGAQLWREGA
jgi:hypothetical protein